MKIVLIITCSFLLILAGCTDPIHSRENRTVNETIRISEDYIIKAKDIVVFDDCDILIDDGARVVIQGKLIIRGKNKRTVINGGRDNRFVVEEGGILNINNVEIRNITSETYVLIFSNGIVKLENMILDNISAPSMMKCNKDGYINNMIVDNCISNNLFVGPYGSKYSLRISELRIKQLGWMGWGPYIMSGRIYVSASSICYEENSTEGLYGLQAQEIIASEIGNCKYIWCNRIIGSRIVGGNIRDNYDGFASKAFVNNEYTSRWDDEDGYSFIIYNNRAEAMVHGNLFYIISNNQEERSKMVRLDDVASILDLCAKYRYFVNNKLVVKSTDMPQSLSGVRKDAYILKDIDACTVEISIK